MIVHGQTHGSIAHGVAKACSSTAITTQDRAGAGGELYGLRYAARRHFPPLKTALSEVPSPSNRLGVRSGGECGATPALAAVIYAIVDALSEHGVRHIEMPATPERVWRAVQEGRADA
jgi:aerobic carbon-monoxide dehydrogenase large subunit